MFGFTLFKFLDYTKHTMKNGMNSDHNLELKPVTNPEKKKKDYTRLVIGIVSMFGILLWSGILFICISQNISQFLVHGIVEVILLISIFILNFYKKKKMIDYIKYTMIALVFAVSFIL